MESLYLSSSTSETAQLWNEQRSQVLRDALQNMLPSLERELKTKLLREAEEAVAARTAQLVRSCASRGEIEITDGGGVVGG